MVGPAEVSRAPASRAVVSMDTVYRGGLEHYERVRGVIDRALLARTAELAADHLDAVGERHAGPLAGHAELRAALGGAAAGARASRPSEVIEALARDAAPGPRRLAGPALLRVRHRRRAAGGARGRLARVGVGPERASAPSPRRPRRSSRRSRAAGCSICSGCRRDVGVGFATGAQMANFTGLAAARHARARARGLGRRGATGLSGAPPIARARGRGGARDGLARAAAARARARARSTRSRPTIRAAMRADALARRSPPATGRRSSARRPAT